MMETVRLQCWALDKLGLTWHWLPRGWAEEPVNTRWYGEMNFSYQITLETLIFFSHPAGATDPYSHGLLGSIPPLTAMVLFSSYGYFLYFLSSFYHFSFSLTLISLELRHS